MYLDNPPPNMPRSRGMTRVGFTLVEIMIVVAVLGILAALVVPKFLRVRDKAEATAAGTSMKAIADAVKHYQALHGEWPDDKNRRVLPTELKSYLPSNEFESAPLGGVWDYEDWRGTGNKAGGTRIGIAISIVEGDPDLYEGVDKAIDDGDLATGMVRYCESSPRLVYVLLFE